MFCLIKHHWPLYYRLEHDKAMELMDGRFYKTFIRHTLTDSRESTWRHVILNTKDFPIIANIKITKKLVFLISGREALDNLKNELEKINNG